jgi:hypothetical protein
MKSSEKLSMVVLHLQLLVALGVSFSARTPLIWIWVVSSFIPPVFLAVARVRTTYIGLSLCLLFVTQHLAYYNSISGQPIPWISDSWGDNAVLQSILTTSHWVPGLGAVYRLMIYSLYPAAHIAAAELVDITSSSPYPAAESWIMIAQSVVLSLVLFSLYRFLLKNELKAVFATSLFASDYWYAYFYSQFDREVYALPLVLAAYLTFLWYKRTNDRKTGLTTVLLGAVASFAHVIGGLILIGLILVSNPFKNRRYRVLFLTLLVIDAVWITYVSAAYATSTIYGLLATVVQTFTASFTVQSLPLAGNPIEFKLFTYSAYALVIFFTLVGMLKLTSLNPLSRRLAFVGLGLFVIAAGLRILASSWAVGLFYRFLPYSYFGIGIGFAIGISSIYVSLSSSSRIAKVLVFIVILFLAAGSLSQQSFVVYPIVTGVPNPPTVYFAALWVKQFAVAGSSLAFTGNEVAVEVQGLDRSDAISLYAGVPSIALGDLPVTQQAAFHGILLQTGQYNFSRATDIVYCNPSLQFGYI